MSVMIRLDQRQSDVRPWGSWEVLDEGHGYKVKRLSVDGHSRLSLQTHAHRSEYWLVVSGTATCTVGRRQVVLEVGDHLYVPRGTRHRIANDAPDGLVLVEVQLGSYLGEDDIVRLEDDYGRG
jgi:mannose-6-phosphate isomerase-like protein (cupin superfamily)